MTLNRADLVDLDRCDPLARHRDAFQLASNLIYLDGNSLGPAPKAVAVRVADVTTGEWGDGLIGSWNSHDWINLPQRVGDRIAPLIGAAVGEVVATDSTSVNLFKTLVAGLGLNSGRSTVLSVSDNFPTDLYMAQGLEALLGKNRCELQLVGREELLEHIDETIAVVMLTHVDFRTGRMFDMKKVTARARECGAMVLWDLAHSAGAMPIAVNECGVDLAVGCGYKFLNGGPGAPAFVFVAKRHHSQIQQPLTGWMGHEDPFAFSSRYAPGAGIRRFLSGTPSVIALSALDAALDVWEDIDLQEVRAKSVELGGCLIELIEGSPTLSDFELRSPRDEGERGSQVSFAHPLGYSIIQALIDARVIGDFRAPDVLRFGLTPLYTRYVDIWEAVVRLERIMTSRAHEDPRYSVRNSVT